MFRRRLSPRKYFIYNGVFFLALLGSACMSLEPRLPTTLPEIPAPVFDTNNPESLAELTAQLDDKRVILIGEIHDVLSHHQNQLSIIKSVYARNQKLAIGI